MAISKTKVAIIGAGKVGSTLAAHLAARRLCSELVLVDLDQKKAWAEATDLRQSMGYTDSRMRIWDGSYYDCADADICVLSVAAQFPPNTPRLEQMDHAASMIGRIVPSVMATGFEGIFLVITNPVDLMTWLVQQLSGLDDRRVIGLGTALDTARLRCHLADALHVAPWAVEAFVLGEHGGDQVIPWSQVSVDGKPLEEILREDPQCLPGFDEDGVSNSIAEVAYNLATVKGAPIFSVAAATAEIIAAILQDSGAVLTVSAALHGEYGEEDVCVGVPAILGSQGVERVVEYPLNDSEREHFQRTVRSLRHYMTDIS
jgi:L-lactate dehydrogenase